MFAPIQTSRHLHHLASSSIILLSFFSIFTFSPFHLFICSNSVHMTPPNPPRYFSALYDYRAQHPYSFVYILQSCNQPRLTIPFLFYCTFLASYILSIDDPILIHASDNQPIKVASTNTWFSLYRFTGPHGTQVSFDFIEITFTSNTKRAGRSYIASGSGDDPTTVSSQTARIAPGSTDTPTGTHVYSTESNVAWLLIAHPKGEKVDFTVRMSAVTGESLLIQSRSSATFLLRFCSLPFLTVGYQLGRFRIYTKTSILSYLPLQIMKAHYTVKDSKTIFYLKTRLISFKISIEHIAIHNVLSKTIFTKAVVVLTTLCP